MADLSEQDYASYLAFVARHSPLLVAKGLLICGSLYEAEAAAQYACDEALANWHDLRSPEAWTMTVTIRRLCRKKKLWHRLRPLPDHGIPLPGGCPVEERMKVLDLLALLDELPRRQRQVMVLRGELEMTPAEIAEVLEVSANSVSNATSVATAKLRFLLGREDRRVSSGDGLSSGVSEDHVLLRLREAADWLLRGIRADRRSGRPGAGR
ncbi:RNA polymerase sigma factor [Streptomyces sp. NBC_00582]|uniref:RNA polymerase sigma factor n=1 Tax=Streptomyces sp. NBC_00582 TaxID=2975783 RepID=UPI001064336B|nr:sigma factor-like helix-turn-helix DNA-binding protein [Streptomyces sp. NBC_00582]WUB60170.1 hypothetical protein OG852_07095 [Streptomyces sp. NBC_00582]